MASLIIYEKITSGKVLCHVTNLKGLLKFCNPKKAKKILQMNETGKLNGIEFGKDGAIFYQYNY